MFDILDSTNQYLLDAASDGAESGLVVIARRQTAGRGRRGRVWDSKPGASLLLSVLFHPTEELPAHRFGQALGLAIVDACQLYGGFDASLKWPNDVLVADRKLAGVLVEAITQGDRMHVVAGCGINVNWAGSLPEALHETAVSADERAGRPLDLDVLTDRLLCALEERLAHSSWIPEAYRDHCGTVGRQVRVELPSGTVIGRATDVTDDGALVVTPENGEPRVFASGEVVHVRTA